MQVELPEEVLLDPGRNTGTEEGAVRHDHTAPAPRLVATLPPKFAHDQLQEEKCCL